MIAAQQQYDAFQESWRPTQEKVDKAIRLAIEIARPSRIFLFGSWPSGKASIDSDLDIAVFLPDSSSQTAGETEEKLLEALDEIPLSIDLVMATESTVSDFRDSINSIFSLILREGKLVYEQSNRGQSANAAA
ncbi:nucleotidyltransferase domain-containing protein [Acidicapsa ligni]|uniref:nucleotidyltransferase domain-containing protein n=1 Tax=Acidicapsa ligni TaxID=542300 RepID=UPI0021DF5216|nr:nucleotidyltransferase domain-containing protein [Acidicapsa ligni]